jgi:hypothetical protein
VRRAAFWRALRSAGLGAAAGFLIWRLAEPGAAAVAAGLTGGILIAVVLGRCRRAARTHTDCCDSSNQKPESCGTNATRQRLEEEKASLDKLDRERERRGDPGFDRTTEERVVWGELLELELQDLDEQLSRICNSAGNEPGPGERGNSPGGNPRKGGSHGNRSS